MSSSRLLHLLDNLSWSLGRVRAEPAVLPAGRRGNMAVAGRAARRSSPRAGEASEKGAFSPIRRHAQRRTCISIPCRLRSPPVLPARLPALPERQTAPQHAFPRKPAKIRRATQQRLCPTGANSVAPAPSSVPCPIGARQRRPTRAVPTRHHSSTSAASARPALPSTPTSPSPPNRRRRRAPARGPAAVCALHRPARNVKKRPCPLLVGHGRVDIRAEGCWPPALPASWGLGAVDFGAKGAGRRHRRLEYFRGARIYYSHHAGAPAEKEW